MRNQRGLLAGVQAVAVAVVLFAGAGLAQAQPAAQATATAMPTPTAMGTVSATEMMTETTGMPGLMDLAAAAQYCTEQGGTVVTRYPTYNTNGPQSGWVRLGNPRQFCNFRAAADENGFRSQIEIELGTLYSDQPTLAVLAYLEPVALPPFTGANPSTLYCNKLGGTDIWGGMNNAAGGGWVTDAPDSDTNFQVVGMCVFPDMSAIDTWGLTYKANGIVRGTDLTQLVRYKATPLPPVFVSAGTGNEPALGTVDKMLTRSDNNSTVTLKVGDTMSIALDSNPSTGFSWQLRVSDEKVVQAVGEPQFDLGPNKTPMPGAGGTETFNLRAVGAGTATVTLVYVRPWETTVTPTPNDTFTVQVTVQ